MSVIKMHRNVITFEYVGPESTHWMHFLLFMESLRDFVVFISFFGLCPNVPISGLDGQEEAILYIFLFPKIYPNISFYFLFSVIGRGNGKNCCLLYCLETAVGATKEICPWCTTPLQQCCFSFRNSLRVLSVCDSNFFFLSLFQI